MITINGLTKSQVRMLDKMWAIDGYEEYQEWKATLCYAQKQQCSLLEDMILLAEIDEMVDAGEGTEVGDLLNRYRG
jgi:hypothetical protein